MFDSFSASFFNNLCENCYELSNFQFRLLVFRGSGKIFSVRFGSVSEKIGSVSVRYRFGIGSVQFQELEQKFLS